MPSFSIDINRTKYGLRIIVPVIIGDASRVEIPNDASGAPQTVEIKGGVVNGLIDTGATMSCVTKSCAKRLALKVCGTRNMATASSDSVKVNVYRDALVIAVHGRHPVIPGQTTADNEQPLTTIPMSNPIIVQAGEFVNMRQDDVDVLVGMDVIQSSVMTVNGHDNRLTMSF